MSGRFGQMVGDQRRDDGGLARAGRGLDDEARDRPHLGEGHLLDEGRGGQAGRDAVEVEGVRSGHAASLSALLRESDHHPCADAAGH